MQQIAAIVKNNRWTQTEAVQRCGITQPRMNDLLCGRVSRSSLGALVNIATAIGRRVHMELGVGLTLRRLADSDSNDRPAD